MSVGILLISHPGIASNLLETARKLFADAPLQAQVIEVPFDSSVDQALQLAGGCLRELNQGQGVLILTDLYGSTPANICNCLLEEPGFKLVSGLNLPMLIRALNYPDLDLTALAEKAASGGRDGILICDCKQP